MIPVHNDYAEQNGSDAHWIAVKNIVENKGDMAKTAQANYSTWVGKAGSFITTNCTEEQMRVAMAICNYGYTEEGMVYWNYGEEGVSFNYDENGNPQYTDLVVNHPLGVAEARRIYVGTVTNIPASAAMAAQYFDPEVAEANRVWLSNNVADDYRIPSLTYSDEVRDTRTDLYNTIKSYVDEMGLKFVTGEISLDQYDEYEKKLETLGLQQLLKLTNDAYKEFVERGGLTE